jgi:hypothetical protein
VFPTLLLLACLSAQTGFQQDSHVGLPLHGTVHKNILYGFFGKAGDTSLDAIPVENPPKSRFLGYMIGLDGKKLESALKPGWKSYYLHGADGFFYDFGAKRNYRHQIKYDSVWFLHGYGHVPRLKFKELNLFDTSNKDFYDQFAKKLGLSKDVSISFYQIRRPIILDKYFRSLRETEGNAAPLPPARNVLSIGSVATSDTSLKCYMLVKPKRYVEIWETLFRWDDKIQGWKTTADGKNLEKIPAPFAEDFHFFIRQSDYFFVTQSGKLYVAPSPKKDEKSRTISALWDDAKRPIVAVIEDADNDKVWLFAKDKNAGAKLDLYFEMKDAIATKSFDPTKLRPVNVEGRAKLLLEYLPLVYKNAKK